MKITEKDGTIIIEVCSGDDAITIVNAEEYSNTLNEIKELKEENGRLMSRYGYLIGALSASGSKDIHAILKKMDEEL